MKKLITINWKKAKSLITENGFIAIGSSFYQINNQGTYLFDGYSLYKQVGMKKHLLATKP